MGTGRLFVGSLCHMDLPMRTGFLLHSSKFRQASCTAWHLITLCISNCQLTSDRVSTVVSQKIRTSHPTNPLIDYKFWGSNNRLEDFYVLNIHEEVNLR
jgi:hypothetical protein